MDSETEMIRQQMEGTRKDLSEKLGKLEEQLDQKVHKTAEKVADTVESVSETVEGVKEQVEGTVEAVKHTFDLNWHAQNHPWLLVGGAVAVGYLGTSLLMPPRRSARRDWEYDRRRERERFEQERRDRERWEQERRRAEQHGHQGHSHGVLGGALNALAPLLDLKKVAIGLAMGVAREMISSSLPAALGSAVGDAINQVTERLGGKPMSAAELPFTLHSEPSQGSQQGQQPPQRQAQGSGI